MSGTGLGTFYGAEPILLIAVLAILWRSKERRRYPALVIYLLIRIASDLVLWGLLFAHGYLRLPESIAYPCYFWTFWSAYIAASVAVFFVLFELFQQALDPLPAMKRMGTLIFRCIAGISVVAALASVALPFSHSGYQLLFAVCSQLMRCESVFTLCMLLFLMVASTKLGLSYGSRIFGFSVGFAILGATNLVVASLTLRSSRDMWTSQLSVLSSAATLFALVVWIAYLVRKEPARAGVRIPQISSLARWNEIAASFGYTANAAATASSSRGLFLKDVEHVVDRVLVKNSLHMTG